MGEVILGKSILEKSSILLARTVGIKDGYGDWYVDVRGHVLAAQSQLSIYFKARIGFAASMDLN